MWNTYQIMFNNFLNINGKTAIQWIMHYSATQTNQSYKNNKINIDMQEESN